MLLDQYDLFIFDWDGTLMDTSQIAINDVLDSLLFADVKAMLELLSTNNKLLAVATGRSRSTLDIILAATGCQDYFVITKTACECFSKPHPQMIDEIVDFCGVAKTKTVMIGDTRHDILMAHNAEVDAIAISHYPNDYLALQSSCPKYLVNNVSELYSLLKNEKA